MCRPSVISDDRITKGFHIHLGPVELAVHPMHMPGKIAFASCFSATPAREVEAAIKMAREHCLADLAVRTLWCRTIDRAIEYLNGQATGVLADLANGRKAELTFLKHAWLTYEPE